MGEMDHVLVLSWKKVSSPARERKKKKAMSYISISTTYKRANLAEK
jgi:hypothetical protein